LRDADAGDVVGAIALDGHAAEDRRPPKGAAAAAVDAQHRARPGERLAPGHAVLDVGVGTGADAVVLDVEIRIAWGVDCIKTAVGIARVAVELQIARAHVVVGADGVLPAPRRTLRVGLARHVEALAVDDLSLFVERGHVLAD